MYQNLLLINFMKKLKKNKRLAIEGLELQAKRMKMASDAQYLPLKKGNNVTIPVPDVDRSKSDPRNLIGM